MSLRNTDLSVWEARIKPAQIILLVDKENGAESLIYGEQRLKRIKRTLKTEKTLVLKIPIDYASSELEEAILLVTKFKGASCYQGKRLSYAELTGRATDNNQKEQP